MNDTITDNTIIKCTRCRNKHKHGDRVIVLDGEFEEMLNSTCPSCGGLSFDVVKK